MDLLLLFYHKTGGNAMRQGDMMKLNDNSKALVIRGSDYGDDGYSVVALYDGYLRFIDANRDTLMYSLGELVLKCDHNIKKDYHI